MATKTKSAPVKKTTKPAAAKVDRKDRKPYPSREERVSMANTSIDRLTQLNQKREQLIAKTEKTLVQRKAALEKSAAALEKAVAKKVRLENIGNVEAKIKRGTRAVKSAEKAKIQQLQTLLDKSGKTIDDLLSELKP